MAVTLVNAMGMVKGLDSAETGLKIESVRETLEPQFKEPVLDHVGHRIGTGVGHKMSKYSVNGEAVYSTGAITGPLIPQFTTAVTIANASTQMESGGGVYMNSVEVTKNRGTWQAVSAEFESFEDQA